MEYMSERWIKTQMGRSTEGKVSSGQSVSIDRPGCSGRKPG